METVSFQPRASGVRARRRLAAKRGTLEVIMTRWIGWFVVGVLAVVATAWAAEDPAEARIRKDVTFLASDECEGRGVATQGIHKAADHVAAEFKKAGLKPGV